MTDRQQNRRSALVFGARNLGRAVIENLIDDDPGLITRICTTRQPFRLIPPYHRTFGAIRPHFALIS